MKVPIELTRKTSFVPIQQLSIYAENKVGRLNDLISILLQRDIHILAITSIDNTDSVIIRIIVNYFEEACQLLYENHFRFSTHELIGVELDAIDQIKQVTCALVEAEINIHYAYPFLSRPEGRPGFVMRLEDNELAAEVLMRRGIRILNPHDLGR